MNVAPLSCLVTGFCCLGLAAPTAVAAAPVQAEQEEEPAPEPQPRVLITEIMYNPASNERTAGPEWVEIANVGEVPVQMNDWRLADEDNLPWGPFSGKLDPGEVAILINNDWVSEKAFRAAWDRPPSGDEPVLEYQIFPVKWGSLANDPDADNEILSLLDDNDRIICQVNFQRNGDWPQIERLGGPSIYLTDITVNAEQINDGRFWKRSQVGRDGAQAVRKTEIFEGDDVGSPGFVPGLTRPAEEDEDPDDQDQPEPEGDDDEEPTSEPDPDNEIDY